MIALTWWIAAGTVVLALAIVLAALAFLRRDQRCRTTCTTAQACERHTARAAADIARIRELIEQHLADRPAPTRVRFAPPETPAERTQPQTAVHDVEPTGRHALADHTRHLPNIGSLPAVGGEDQ